MHWFDIPIEEMTFEWLVNLITSLEASTGVSESPWIEVKSERRGQNIAEAVGALANASGGLVLVGILDQEDSAAAKGADRVVGVPKKEYEPFRCPLRPLWLTRCLRFNQSPLSASPIASHWCFEWTPTLSPIRSSLAERSKFAWTHRRSTRTEEWSSVWSIETGTFTRLGCRDTRFLSMPRTFHFGTRQTHLVQYFELRVL
jgi:hypothetical protein